MGPAPFVVFAFALIVAGCSSNRCGPRTPTVSVSSPPPALLPETISAAPAPGMTWIAGSWHWDETHWVWSPGYHLGAPRGERYYPPVYTAHTYRSGGFGCDPDAKP